MYTSCVISNMFFFLTSSSSTGGRSSCVKRKRSEDVVVGCPATAPCTQAVSRPPSRSENGIRVTPLSGSPYLAAIGSHARNAARGSRMATYPMPQPGPTCGAGLTTPQAAGPSWMPAVTSPLAGRYADGAPKRLKTDSDRSSVFKSLMED